MMLLVVFVSAIYFISPSLGSEDVIVVFILESNPKLHSTVVLSIGGAGRRVCCRLLPHGEAHAAIFRKMPGKGFPDIPVPEGLFGAPEEAYGSVAATE